MKEDNKLDNSPEMEGYLAYTNTSEAPGKMISVIPNPGESSQEALDRTTKESRAIVEGGCDCVKRGWGTGSPDYCPVHRPPELKGPLIVALNLTKGPRQEAYGHPWDNFRDIAAGWSVIFKQDIKPEQVALAMIWTKICRENTTPQFDNEVDIAGYVNTLNMVKQGRKDES